MTDQIEIKAMQSIHTIKEENSCCRNKTTKGVLKRRKKVQVDWEVRTRDRNVQVSIPSWYLQNSFSFCQQTFGKRSYRKNVVLGWLLFYLSCKLPCGSWDWFATLMRPSTFWRATQLIHGGNIQQWNPKNVFCHPDQSILKHSGYICLGVGQLF